jgi:S1-C subfamily serine protease
LDNGALLQIELADPRTGEKSQDKFIKMFPAASDGVAYWKDNARTTGSGFFISSEGIIATNAHVVERASNIEVTVANEAGNITYKAKTLLIDSKNDVALLQIDDEKFKKFNSIPYGMVENSDVGSRVFTIGYPLNDVMGSNYKVTDGIISSKSGIADDVRYYQISVPLQPGNSGGPLFNKENVNYAIKSSYLLSLYNMLPNPTKIPETSQVAARELQDQVKVLKNFVCLIKAY